MHGPLDFLLRRGYVVIAVAVFIEQIGLPIPRSPAWREPDLSAEISTVAVVIRCRQTLASQCLQIDAGRRQWHAGCLDSAIKRQTMLLPESSQLSRRNTTLAKRRRGIMIRAAWR
jgi:hypothetical protein